VYTAARELLQFYGGGALFVDMDVEERAAVCFTACSRTSRRRPAGNVPFAIEMPRPFPYPFSCPSVGCSGNAQFYGNASVARNVAVDVADSEETECELRISDCKMPPGKGG
jgi:hypothetical protein